MAANTSLPNNSPSAATLAERLERGEVIFFSQCAFALPEGEDRAFLFTQQQHPNHKNITFNPHTDRVSGFCWQSPENTERLQRNLKSFGEQAADWVRQNLPNYAKGLHRDRVTLRPEEEATRRLRRMARNDLLHIDSFPNRPTHGARILRLFVNINPTDPRVWATSETFGPLFQRYGREVGLPGSGKGLAQHLGDRFLGIFDPKRRQRSSYDAFMLRFHHFLKANESFQERCRKRFWSFPPGSMWLVFTDAASHAVLRGRFALEHSFFVSQNCLALPEEAPAAILEGTSLSSQQSRAA